MDEKIFKKTEAMLYSYYKDQKNLSRLKNKVEALIVKNQKLDEDIRFAHKHITLSGDVQAINYGKPSVQSNGDGSGHAERELMNQISKMENERIITCHKVLKNKAIIRDIESRNTDIEFVICMMDEESKRFVELKYGDGASFYFIADDLHISKSTVFRKRQEIVEDVARYFNFYGK